jgi:hypothetical protein
MKMIITFVGMCVWLLSQYIANGFYNESVGRWLSRDPVGEVGFQLSNHDLQLFLSLAAEDVAKRANSALREPGGPNLNAFLLNAPIAQTDPTGLLKFDGCSSAQVTQLQNDFNSYCAKLKTSLTGCCKNETILPKLEFLCNNNKDLTIKCEASSTGKCSGGPKSVTCAWSVPGGNTIHMCPDGLGASCGPLGCTLLHEMTHIIGHGGEKWPQSVEKCLGCK